MMLDTHVLIWTMSGERYDHAVRDDVDRASAAGALSVSAVSAWEVGLLAAKRRVIAHPDATAWWHEALSVTRARVLALDADIALEATRLPGSFHADPADRFLVATARHFDLPILTADKSILAYA